MGPLSSRFHLDEGEIAVDWTAFVHPSADLAAALLEALLDPKMTAITRGAAARASSGGRRARWTATLGGIALMGGQERAVMAALSGDAQASEMWAGQGEGARARGGEMWPGYEVRRALFGSALRRLVALPEVARFWQLMELDDGTPLSVRPVGYSEEATMADLALVSRKAELRALALPWKALLAVMLAAYGNELLLGEVFKGRGLALATGEAAPAIWRLPESVRRDALLLMANYAGW